MPFRWADSKRLPTLLRRRQEARWPRDERGKLASALWATVPAILAPIVLGTIYLGYVVWTYASADVVVAISAAPTATRVQDADLEALANRAGKGARNRALEISDRFSSQSLQSMFAWVDHDRDGTYCAPAAFYDLGLVSQIMEMPGEGPVVISEETLTETVVQSGSISPLIADLAGRIRGVLNRPYKRLNVVIDDNDGQLGMRVSLDHFHDPGDADGWRAITKTFAFPVPDLAGLEPAIETVLLRVSYPAISAVGLPHRGLDAMGIEAFLGLSLPPEGQVLVDLGMLQALDHDGHLNQAALFDKAFTKSLILRNATRTLGRLAQDASDADSRATWLKAWALMNISGSNIQTAMNRMLRRMPEATATNILAIDPIVLIAQEMGLAPHAEETGGTEGDLESIIRSAHPAFVVEMGTVFLTQYPNVTQDVIGMSLADPSAPLDIPPGWRDDDDAVLPRGVALVQWLLYQSKQEQAAYRRDPWNASDRHAEFLEQVDRFHRLSNLLSQLPRQDRADADFILGTQLVQILGLAMRFDGPVPELSDGPGEDPKTAARRLIRDNASILGARYAAFLDLALALAQGVQSNQPPVVSALMKEFDDFPVCAGFQLLNLVSASSLSVNRETAMTDLMIAGSRRLIERGFRNFTIFNSLGVALGRTGDLDGALAAYEEARRYSEGSLAWSYSNASMIHVELGDFEAAENSARQALSEQGSIGFSFTAARRNLLNTLLFQRDTIGFARALAEIDEAYALAGAPTTAALETRVGYSPADLRTTLQTLYCITGIDPTDTLAAGGYADLAPSPRAMDCLRASVTFEKSLIDVLRNRQALRPASDALTAQDYPRAVRHLSEVLASDPGNAVALWLRGMANVEIGNDDDALADLDRAIQLGGQWPTGFTSRAIVHARKGNRAQALADLDRAAAVSAFPASLLLVEAAVHEVLGDIQAARNAFENAANAFPNDPEPWRLHAKLLSRLDRSEEAITVLSEGLAQHPQDVDLQNHRGNLFYALGRHDEALADYTSAVNTNADNGSVFSNRGNALWKLGRFDEALGAYDRAIALGDRGPIVWNGRANALRDLARPEEAIEDYTKAIALDPDYALAFNGRANALHDLERYEEALSDYETAIDLSPDDAMPVSNRGNTLLAMGRVRDAMVSFETATRLDSDYVLAFNNLAWLLATGPVDILAPERAVALSAHALASADRPEPFLHGTHAAALIAAGRGAEAFRQYEKAMALAPDWIERYREYLIERGYLDGPATKGRDAALDAAIRACIADGCQLLAP